MAGLEIINGGRNQVVWDGSPQQGTGAEPRWGSGVLDREGTGSYFVTQRPSDPGIQRPGDPVDPVTLFYNKLQMSTYV